MTFSGMGDESLAQVTFKGSNGALVINSIAEDNDGHISLTFSFSFPVPKSIEPGSEDEAAKKRELYKIGKDAVDKSVVTTLEMFEAGKL
ncbi:hypothetical protein FS749_010035 [Ceratobasidium sp. UAMH 11750]|nr:hypothetical protein FS749_010035 [Ceratobasidium sp. UAMH 11750]